jgi:hypothetical protein
MLIGLNWLRLGSYEYKITTYKFKSNIIEKLKTKTAGFSKGR